MAMVLLMPLFRQLGASNYLANQEKGSEISGPLFVFFDRITKFVIEKMFNIKKSMRMKKFLLVLAAAFCVVTTASAAGKIKQAAQTVASQKWSVGARVGSGFQAQAECFYSDSKYVEGRLGMSWVYGGVLADFSVLHNWNVCKMDWTPDAGQWFLDAGVGANVGGAANLATIGVTGQVKLGIKFDAAPIRLAFDFSPVIGPAILYWKGGAACGFNTMGLCNLGISATYCF